jgi:translation initiation factor 2 subunit 1
MSKLNLEPNIRKELVNIIKIKMVPQPVKIRADFKLTCFKFEGIDAIKAALLEGEKLSTTDIPIKFRVIGSPLYECTTTTINKAEGLKLIGNALKIVESSIKLREGNFLLQTKPVVLGDTAEKGLQQQIEDKVKNIEEESDEEQEEGIIADIEGMDDDDLKLTKNKKKREEDSESEEDEDN